HRLRWLHRLRMRSRPHLRLHRLPQEQQRPRKRALARRAHRRRSQARLGRKIPRSSSSNEDHNLTAFRPAWAAVLFRSFLLLIRFGILLLVVSLVRAAAAGAAPNHPPLAQALKGDARVLYDSARELFKAGDYVSAYAKFQRAFELSNDPRLYWNMAACERKV